MLDAIDHIALVVRDAERTARLFQHLFDCEIVRRTDKEGDQETLVRLGTTWIVLAEAAMERPLSGDHIAFRVSREALEATAEKLKAMGMEFMRSRCDSALYFSDYDSHMFELDTIGIAQEFKTP